MLKLFSRQEKNFRKILFGSNDLPSMKEIIENHVEMLNAGQQGKYMKTTCTSTLNIAEKILKDNPFLHKNLMSCPGVSTSETGSIKVKVCDINNNEKIKAQYQSWKTKGKSRIVAIGGPSAYDQTLISSFIDSIRSTHDVNFYCRNYLETNVLHSANQSHARHGNALNADPVLSGRHLLPLVFKRMLFRPSVSDVIEPDFIKVDVKLDTPKYLVEYVKNEYNGIHQIVKSWLGQKNQHDLNRLESIVSQQIQKVMEKSTGLVFTSNHGKKIADSMAIYLIFSQESLDEFQIEQSQFSRVQELKWQDVPVPQLKKLFPQSKDIVAGFKYPGDFTNVFDMYELEKEKSKKLGAVWEENKTLSRVYVDKDANGNPFACGVQFQDGEFVPADKIHLTLGYKAYFQYEKNQKNALNNINVPATGVSVTFVIKKTPELKKIIQEKGSPELAIINSHWTVIGHDDEYVLMRATAGGNTGAQTYMPSYLLNLSLNTRNIFGDAFVGILSVYGCVRAVNYKNSTQFAKLANGLVVSYGKGGTGNTKRASQAYKALKYLGFQKQLVEYFSPFETQRLNIVKKMDYLTKQSVKNGFYYDNTRKTKRALFL